jgi:poly-beta-1,6-N-acetyl-D-glucosamine synthase
MVIVVRNEESTLERKIENVLALDYPPDRAEIIIVSDGSTDRTAAILQKYAVENRFRTVLNSFPRGKAAGLNDAITLAKGEVVVFTDARQLIDPGAINLLLENFADPDVGCVSGDLMLGDPGSSRAPRGLGLYWGLEKKLWELESASGSAVGATGPFYAARRDVLPALPAETVLDDVYIPMEIARQGKRVLIDPRAKACDPTVFKPEQEWPRKVRTLSGNYQLLKLQPWLLTSANPIRFEFVSHRLLKLWAPFLMLALLAASISLGGPVYRLALALQLLFYTMSIMGLLPWRKTRLARVCHSGFIFLLLNAAALAASANFVSGRKIVWKR